MSEETIFTKIINGTIPSKTIYHDDLVTAFHDLALYQMMGNRNSLRIYSLDNAILDNYAKSFTAEAIQLYYQICLSGIEECKNAPDQSTAFEMAILRLLAFTAQKKKIG